MTFRRHATVRFWVVLIFCATAASLIFNLREQGSLAAQQERLHALQLQYASLNDQHASLERQLAFAKTDEYIERTARTSYSLLKPGEIRFVSDEHAGNLP